MSKLGNAHLVAAHVSGDARAFQELVALYRTRLRNFVNRMIGDRERAEDHRRGTPSLPVVERATDRLLGLVTREGVLGLYERTLATGEHRTFT